MIELLIERRTRQPIMAMRVGSPWTLRELDGPNLCVVKLNDPPAELAALVARRGIVSNPFAEWDVQSLTVPETGEEIRLPKLIRQSTVQLRLADIQQGKVVQFSDVEVSIIE